MNLKSFAFILLILACAVGAMGQVNADIGIKSTFAGGDVTAIAEGKISLSTVDGPIVVELLPATAVKRVAADNPSLKAATDATLAEIAVGDKLLVHGLVSEDKKLITAKTVYLMTKASISEKKLKEDQDWAARGQTGTVESVDALTNLITISIRAMGPVPARKVTIKPGAKTVYKRFPPDSSEYGKAIASTIGEIEKGDELRVLGNKNADGSEVDAEIILTGSFRQTGGIVKKIDLAKGELVIEEISTKKDVTVQLLPTSNLRRLPDDIAQRLAGFQRMQMAGAMGGGGMRPPTGGQPQGGGQQTPQPTGGQQNPQQRPGGTGQGGGFGGGGGGGMRGGLDVARLPVVKIEDVKIGDAIQIVSSKPKDPKVFHAITLLTGIEPIVKAYQDMIRMGGGGGGGGQRGGGSGFSIPGLEGFGN